MAEMSRVLPLYLNLDETRALAVAVGVQIQIDSTVVLNEEMMDEEIAQRYRPEGTTRADQVLAAARQRLPVLRNLQTALLEHGETLDRMQDDEERR
jgi:hypothetical protein